MHVLDGATTLTILGPTGPTVLEMTAGVLTVVPRGHWHKFHAPDGVAVLTMTPTPTDHSTAELPE